VPLERPSPRCVLMFADRNSKKEGPGVLSFPDERNWRGARVCSFSFIILLPVHCSFSFIILLPVHCSFSFIILLPVHCSFSFIILLPVHTSCNASAGIWKMDEPVGVGVWRKKDKNGNWVSEKSEFDPDASKKRADHLDHFLKLPSFQQRYELEVKARDSVRDARKCAGSCAECYSFSLQLQQPL
jgi:hypothetical protein